VFRLHRSATRRTRRGRSTPAPSCQRRKHRQPRDAPVNFVIPDEGITSYDYYTGVASTATNLAACTGLSELEPTKRGQQVFSDIGEYSVRTDAIHPISAGRNSQHSTTPKVHRITQSDSILNAPDDQTCGTRSSDTTNDVSAQATTRRRHVSPAAGSPSNRALWGAKAT